MSRTIRKNKKGETCKDGKTGYRCRCEYCIGQKYKNRKGLTAKEALDLT